MNYPLWQLPTLGGGLLIAIIAVLHVYISHLAVGGGLFLVWTERKARRENDPALLDYVRRHTWFFLLLTMVFGGISGVGIWFIISLVHPSATSTLIHAFVFGWAIEWVFFIVEIVSLLIYHYYFDRMDPRSHMMFGWLYFAAAWLSLFIINGILSFMLTPGQWIETGNFWHGFFNPTMWPSLVFRTAIALIIAGLFGLVTAAFSRNGQVKATLYRYLARWMILPLVLLLVSGWWYMKASPPETIANILRYNPEAGLWVQVLVVATLGLFVAGLLTLLALPKSFYRIAVWVMLAVGLAWMGGFEYTREIARKPYIIYDYMYSTSVLKKDVPKLNAEGFLKHAKWEKIHEVTDANRMAAGRELFVHQCMICHTTGGYNDVLSRTAKFDVFGMTAQLTGQGAVQTYMPPFVGTEEEKAALAQYIVEGLHGKMPVEQPEIVLPDIPTKIPPFDAEKDGYVLLAWNDLGMHCISDNDKYFVILPPANNLWAQLIRRGPKPQIVTGGDVVVEYEVEDGFRFPEKHVPFWRFVKETFGVNLPPGEGLFKKRVTGVMDFSADKHNSFVAAGIPVVPYTDDDKVNPYPLFTITAKDKASGAVLMSTKAVAPTSTEMGCRNCHGGAWRKAGTGIGDATAGDILAVHDRINGTSLLAEARAGKPRLCQSCHGDPALGAAGLPDMMNLSASMHGFHANYLKGMDAEACNSCHPNREGGVTRCLRGIHKENDITCVECHGSIEDHALSLLKYEQQQGKPQAVRIMDGLKPTGVDSLAKVNPRQPWINEPDCLSCHVGFQPPDDVNAYNTWTSDASKLYRNRTGDKGLICSSCHGSTHAVYPAANPYGENRDTIQPMQYQGKDRVIGTGNGCAVCHRQAMETNAHHPNMLRPQE